MTAQQFKEKFKIGDKIRAKSWDKHEYILITYIGESVFQATTEETMFNGSYAYSMEGDWELAED